MKLNNKVYDILKWIVIIVMPAIGTLYFALSEIWGLPYATQVVGTLTAVEVFLGAILGVSTVQYNKEQKLIQDQTAEVITEFDNISNE